MANPEGEEDQPEQFEEYDDYEVKDTFDHIEVNNNNGKVEEAASAFDLPTFEVK